MTFNIQFKASFNFKVKKFFYEHLQIQETFVYDEEIQLTDEEIKLYIKNNNPDITQDVNGITYNIYIYKIRYHILQLNKTNVLISLQNKEEVEEVNKETEKSIDYIWTISNGFVTGLAGLCSPLLSGINLTRFLQRNLGKERGFKKIALFGAGIGLSYLLVCYKIFKKDKNPAFALLE